MWLAQREDLPDTHKMWADAGSALEATLRALGYVEVPPLGRVADEQPADDEPADDESADESQHEAPADEDAEVASPSRRR